MPKGSSKQPRKKREDEAQAAVRVIGAVAAHSEEEAPVEITDEMRAVAATFGRIGGRIGGPARAAKLSSARRSEIAQKAAEARWKR